MSYLPIASYASLHTSTRACVALLCVLFQSRAESIATDDEYRDARMHDGIGSRESVSKQSRRAGTGACRLRFAFAAEEGEAEHADFGHTVTSLKDHQLRLYEPAIQLAKRRPPLQWIDEIRETAELTSGNE